MNDQIKATLIDEEQLRKVSGGRDDRGIGSGDDGHGIDSGGTSGCVFADTPLHLKVNNQSKPFVEGGIVVMRHKCEKTNLCGECKCRGTQGCKDGWHNLLTCN